MTTSKKPALAAQPTDDTDFESWLSTNPIPAGASMKQAMWIAHAAASRRIAAQPAPAVVPPGYALVPIEPTPKMVAAYLNANDEYWKRADELPPSLFKWRNGTPKDATVESYRAMIAAAGDKT